MRSPLPRRRRALATALALGGLLSSLAPAPVGAAPLAPMGAGSLAPRSQLSVDGPVDLDELLQVARIRAAQMASTFYKYTFRQTTTEEDLNDDGSVKRRETRVYLVVPSPDGTERHLESSDGGPAADAEIRKQEKRNAALKKRWERIREKQKKVADQKRAEKEKAAAKSGGTTPATPKPVAPKPVAQPAPAPSAMRETAPATQPVVSGEPQDAPAPVATSAPPPAATPTISAPAAPALPPLPPCDEDDLESSLRPPLPGSITKSRRPPKLAPEQARRSRDKTSDYSLWELLQLTDYEYAGACQIDGRPMHVLTFEPPETFDAANPVERVMTAMSGTILVDGRDLQVVRAEGLTVAPMTWGAGMVKLKEAHVLLEYAKVQGEIWLPSRDVFEFDTRVFLDHDRQRYTHVFDDFKKATVEVETEYEYTETPPTSSSSTRP